MIASAANMHVSEAPGQTHPLIQSNLHYQYKLASAQKLVIILSENPLHIYVIMHIINLWFKKLEF